MKVLLICLLPALLFPRGLFADTDQNPADFPHAYWVPNGGSSGNAGFAPSGNGRFPPPPVPNEGNLPWPTPILTDPNGYTNENNWLACIIARRIVDFACLTLHPGIHAPADIKISARVDAARHQVHLDIANPSSPPVAADLQPDFAWDPHGYAALAGTLLGTSPPKYHPAEALPDELTKLQNLTGPNLAHEDVVLSNLLQSHPAWAAAHEAAALSLVALALRDNAGDYSDSRRMLCRATAHLALAEALRGTEEPTWAGKIADAGIRALAGREVDALSHLDAMAASPDCPPVAKPWIDAFRLRAKDDWRIVTPSANSPLLLKIAYFEALQDNLTTLPGIKRFDPLGDFPPITDWGHAVMANYLGTSVETANHFCGATLAMEIADLGQVLDEEGVPFDKDHNLGQQLSEPLVEQIYSGKNGVLRIIGPDMFKDYARQHLLLELMRTHEWLKNGLGLSDDAETFRKAAWSNFFGMRLLETTYLFENDTGHISPEQQAILDHVTWHPWELATGDLPQGFINSTDQTNINSFYEDGLPFGTVYSLRTRPRTVEDGAAAHAGSYLGQAGKNERQLVMDYIKTSPYVRTHPFSGLVLNQVLMKKQFPRPPINIYPPVNDLRALAPSSFELFASGRDIADLIASSRPWWDYNVDAIHRVERYTMLLDDTTLDQVLQKHADLDPDIYFEVGRQLRAQGKLDEAAAADRKGFDEDYDEVAMSNQVGPLVDYYYDHGRADEAILVAKKAAETYSEHGLLIYCDLLDQLGRLTDAAQCAQDIYTRYQDHSALDGLFAAHPDFFGDQNASLVEGLFPRGLSKVDFDYFKDPPIAGCRILDDSESLQESGLQPGDIIVALDSYLVESKPQYDYLRAKTRDPHMEIILWRNSRYLIAHTSAPHRFFHVHMETFASTQH